MSINEQKSEKRKKVGIFIAIGLIFIVATVFCYNSTKMYVTSKKRTEVYLDDVTHQVKSKIDQLINTSIETLKVIKNTIDETSEDVKEIYLQHMTQETKFTELLEFDSVEEAQNWLTESYGENYFIDQAYLDQNKVQLLAVLDESKVIYFIQTQGSCVLAGITEDKNLRELLNDSSFNGQGYSFPVTKSGIIITANSEENLFNILEENYNITKKLSKQLKDGIMYDKTGYVEATDKKGEKFFVSYEPLQFATWNIITMVPTSALGISVETYSIINVALTFLAIFIFIILLSYILISQKKYLQYIEENAFTDTVTGGKNMNYFVLEGQNILGRSGKGHDHAVVSIDIKDFKIINNAYGKREGNRVLKYFYHQLKKCLKEDELVARDTADIYFLLLHVKSREELEKRMEYMFHEINAFSKDSEYTYNLDLRCGVMNMEEGNGIDKAVECANIARKNRGNEILSYYDDEMLLAYLREKELIAVLDEALEKHEFEVYLQPKIDLTDNQIISAEALVRWNHPKYGFLSPGEFIPVFENNNVIHKVDMYVFKEVCKMLARWKQEDCPRCKISVNLSKLNMIRPQFLEEYYQTCIYYGASPENIEFELTETVFMGNVDKMCIFIDRMHHYGFSCSLDDFGTGFSSLGLLKDLNIDALKLDRSFFIEKNATGKGMAIVESIISIAGKFHMQTVAEGIDNEEQLAKLRQIGCDVVQGFIFYKPMPIPEFEKIMEEKRERQRLEISEAQKEFQLEKFEDIITMIYDVSNGQVMFSQKPEQFAGDCTLQELIEDYKLIHLQDIADFKMMMSRVFRTEKWLRNEIRVKIDEDRYKWMDLYLRYEKEKQFVIGIFVNYSTLKESIAAWKDRAYHDSLTQLYNRQYFESTILFEISSQRLKQGAVIFIDVDDFKEINDRYGHIVGDEVLRYASMRMRHFFRKQDIVARFGGDEFVIFSPNMNREVLKKRLENMVEVFSTPYRDREVKINISCSIGAVYFEQMVSDYNELLQYADAAMYRAKTSGKNQYYIVTAGEEKKTESR